MKFFSKFFSFCVVITLMTPLSVAASATETADGKWAVTDISRARLIAAKMESDGTGEVTLGLHIQLKPGWKTYWRSPGDSGIAPTFNWQGSKNIRTTEVLWPLPTAFDSFGFLTWGYEAEVLFPVKIKLEEIHKKLKVNLSFAYGVCKEVCVPITQKFSLNVSHVDAIGSGEAAVFNRYMAQVPAPYGPNEVASDLVINKVAKEKIQVVATTSSAFTKPVLILEGEDGDYFAVEETKVSNNGRRVEFSVDTDFVRRLKSNVGRVLKTTIIDGGVGAEGAVPIK